MTTVEFCGIQRQSRQRLSSNISLHYLEMVELSCVVDAPAGTRHSDCTTHAAGVRQAEFARKCLRITSSVEQQVIQVGI